MKFAVLEYHSKSGRIWHHTPAKPNYLADPQKEIDPTSFGCYVSALAGEHIPLTSLILGPTNTVSKPQQLYRKAHKRLLGHWPRTYPLDYLLQFNIILAVHQLSDTPDMIQAITRLRHLRELQPTTYNLQPKIVGVPTQPYGLLKPQVESDPEIKTNLISFIQACDTFISVVKDTTSWYQKLADRPVTYVPQPYPVEHATKSARPRNSKQKIIHVAGVTQRDNIIQGQRVARALQQKLPDYKITIPKVPEYDYDDTELKGTNYEVEPFEPWQQHLNTLAKTMLVINTDYTLTRGRVQTDCAAVATPSLGGNSDATTDLFPDLISDSTTSDEKLITLGTRLLANSDYYDAIVKHATTKLQEYNYKKSAQRLVKLAKTT